MKFVKALASSLIAILTLQSAHGEDTDIYLSPATTEGGSPMVMFALDYRSNLGSTVCQGSECNSLRTAVSPSTGTTYLPASGTVTFFELLRAVLRKVTDDLAPELANVKLGLMINHNNNNNCGGPSKTGCSNGGYMMLGFDTGTGRLHDKLAQIPVPQGNLAHSFQGKELYFELFRYLTGQDIYNGHNGWTDYDTNNQQNLPVDNPNISWDSSIETGNRYESPLETNCSKVFVINFMFQVSQQEDDSDSAIRETKANGGMNQLNITGTNNNFSTVIRFMRDADLADGTWGEHNPNLEDVQNVTSYFFVDPTKINTTTNGYASAGGTNTALPLSSNPQELIDQLKDVFKQILSISTTFVSAAVPVNVFNRTETLENVFYALFQPEATPRWNGNLKRLKLAVDETTGNLQVLDQTGTEAISATDGRIKNEALTFWTSASGADVIAADTDIGEVSGKDGRSVSRGGAGQKILGFLSGSPGTSNASGARNLFTEPDSYTNGTPTAFRALNADATTAGVSAIWDKLKLRGANKSTSCSPSADCWTTAASYAAASATDQTMAVNLLKFARGLDAFDQDADGSTTDVHPWATPSGETTHKPWLMADPLHSKPTPINYGARTAAGYSSTVQDVRILLAGNDGYLHMFRNSTSGSSPEVPSGVEDWAFMPRSLIGNLKLLAENADATPHVYGLDGKAAVYMKDANGDGTIIGSEEKVWAYIGMRRGGKAYYALDISDPDDPKMLWSISKTSGGNFDDLGWTFSDPVVGSLNWGSGEKPVVIFAGGYDTNKDTRSGTNSNNAATGTNDSEGNAIYIVDAETGALVWKAAKTCGGLPATQCYAHADLLDSIPSSVTAVDTDSDGLTDRILVGDTGGVVWRADLTPPALDTEVDPPVYVDKRAEWTITPILSVGRHAGQADRRFFHRPDFVQAKDTTGNFDAVIIGSGDREHPLDTNVQNQFYMFKDRNTLSGNPPSTTKQVSNLDNLTDVTATASNACNCGWYIDLGLGADGGEKSLASPLTFLGKIFFSTYVPAGDSGEDDNVTCGPSEGKAFTYVVNLFTAAGVYDFDTSNDSNGETKERSVETGSGIPSDPIFMSLGGEQFITPGNIPTEEEFRSPLEGRAIWKTFWYEKE